MDDWKRKLLIDIQNLPDEVLVDQFVILVGIGIHGVLSERGKFEFEVILDEIKHRMQWKGDY